MRVGGPRRFGGLELQGRGGMLGLGLIPTCEEDGGTCAECGGAGGDRGPSLPPRSLVSKLQREATRLYKCNINRPFPVLTRWEPALPKDLNSICFIEVSFFLFFSFSRPMHQTIILLRSAALSLLLHPLHCSRSLPRPPHPSVWMSPLILSPLSSPPTLPAVLAGEMP